MFGPRLGPVEARIACFAPLERSGLNPEKAGYVPDAERSGISAQDRRDQGVCSFPCPQTCGV